MLRIISSNIRFDNPKDGNLSWPHRRVLLRDTLLSHNPNIIGTQEGRKDQLYDFLSLLPEFSLIDQHRDWIDERMYPCLYIEKNRFDIIDSGDIWLSETPLVSGSKSFNSMFPRLLTWAKVFDKKEKKNIFLANTHLDHSSDEVRNKQSRVFIDEIKKVTIQDLPLILLGDFNSSPESLVRKSIQAGFNNLIDPWETHGLDFREPSHHNFGEYATYADRIDWILHNDYLQSTFALMDKTMKGDIYPSDHYPIVTELEFVRA